MPRSNRILIAVPESDSHVVAAKLLEYFMKFHGYEVMNLGANSSIDEIVHAATTFRPAAILISSQNGHARKDLEGLRDELHLVQACTNIIVGGKLSINPMDTLENYRADYLPLGLRVAGEFEDALAMIQELEGTVFGGRLAIAN